MPAPGRTNGRQLPAQADLGHCRKVTFGPRAERRRVPASKKDPRERGSGGSCCLPGRRATRAAAHRWTARRPGRGAASAPQRAQEGSGMSTNQQTSRDQRASRSWARGGQWQLAGPWWAPLLTGMAWLIISVIVLRVNTTSVATIGVLMGVIILAAMANEFLIAAVRQRWQWAHVLLGILFLGGAIWAFVHPFGAFWSLASVIGLLLILEGGFVLITSIDSRVINSAWWLGMFAGILMLFVGFWASQQALPARAVLLIIWVGLLALFRGITEIVLAFELKSAEPRLTPGRGTA